MINTCKKAFIFALCLIPIAIVGGIFTALYQFDIYGDDILAEAVAEIGSEALLIAVIAVQTVLYAVVTGFFGVILADVTGLWRPIQWEKRAFFVTLAVSVPAGVLLVLADLLFADAIAGLGEVEDAGLSVNRLIASLLYGGIIEEVMLRLFFLSLLALVLWKIFYKKCEKTEIPTRVFVFANVIAALLFAAGHLPATALIFGGLTPMLVLRCFLLNGFGGLVFGELYRRYGLLYSVIAHMIFHLVMMLLGFFAG